MSKKSRTKGNKRELEIVHIAQQNGFAATKESAMYKSTHDISWPLLGKEWKVEAKARNSGFKQIYAWLRDRDALLVRADRERWLLVVPLVDALPVMKIAEARK